MTILSHRHLVFFGSFFSLLSFLSLLLASPGAQAWGLRGHDTICQAATFLTSPVQLQSFLKMRAPEMGHLCNIPDTHWRALPGEAKDLGGPTHFIDVELLGLPTDQVPLDFEKIITDFQGKPSPATKEIIKSIPTELGSVWWRADQLVRRGIDFGIKAKSSALPKDRKEEQNDHLPFNNNIREMLNSMGILGHYVGDAGQPFHSTLDYDGYGAGHGGIHAFYEHEVVAEVDPKLLADIVARAQVLKKTWKIKGSTLEKMRELSKISILDIKKLIALDKVKTPSVFKKENGIEVKKAAEREVNLATDKALMNKYRPLIVEQMARSALLLADLWNEIYEKSGSPDLKAYKNYKYPLQPDFIIPDYFKAEKK